MGVRGRKFGLSCSASRESKLLAGKLQFEAYMQPTANSNAISCRAFERVSGMLTGDIEWFYFPNICRQNKKTLQLHVNS